MILTKTWISAMRLRTLPLAVSGILMGSALAELNGVQAHKLITILALLTAVFLQILSNLANDYGDFAKGTDNENRVGNMRALQSGNITPQAMLRMIIFFVVLCLISGVSLLYVAADGNLNFSFLLFFILGLVAIAAAIKYTVGKTAYGYSGLGDVFVFVFFGLVAVLGVYILHNNFTWHWPVDKWMVLPATAIGLLSTAVLNTNNIRDIENDRASNKNTIVVKIGLNNARIYHWFLLIGAFFSLVFFIYVNLLHWIQFLSLLAFIPIMMQGIKVQNLAPSPKYNALLKQLSLSILLLVVVFVVLQTVALGIFVSNTISNFVK
jgi:1,4-dihydroxy-2-naphthoate octaprenyltransferase